TIINQALTEEPTMADQKFRSTDQTGSGTAPHGFETPATAAKTVTDQAPSVGRDLKDKAIGLAGSSSDAIKDQASEFVDAAKDVASQAKIGRASCRERRGVWGGCGSCR